MKIYKELLICPLCHGEIDYHNEVECVKCHAKHEIINEVPIMLSLNRYDRNKTDYYSRLSNDLETNIYGRFIKFLNCGYVANENIQYSTIELEEMRVAHNSIKLLLEVIGQVNCNDKRILEIGCGRGGNIHCLSEFYKPELIMGMDISADNIFYCNKKKHQQAYYCVADAENIPITDESFDIVVNIESSLEYSNVCLFYQNVHRILKPDGYFLYADKLPAKEFNRAEQCFSSLGFKIIRAQDVTSNVLLSIDRMKFKYNADDKVIHYEFLTLLEYAKKMEEGLYEYRIYTIRKE